MERPLFEIEHPAKALKDDFMEPYNISAYRLSKEIGLSENALSKLLNGKTGFTANLDLRLARFFGTSEGFWMNMQANYDRLQLKRKLGDELDKIKRFDAA